LLLKKSFASMSNGMQGNLSLNGLEAGVYLLQIFQNELHTGTLKVLKQ